MDEYISELMLGGRNTIVCHNTCEDSLLATPLILDLIILAELCERVRFRVNSSQSLNGEFQSFNCVLSLLSYLCKAPLVEKRGSVRNALFKQRAQIENILRALIALPPLNHMDLQFKCSDYTVWREELAQPVLPKELKEKNPPNGRAHSPNTIINNLA